MKRLLLFAITCLLAPLPATAPVLFAQEPAKSTAPVVVPVAEQQIKTTPLKSQQPELKRLKSDQPRLVNMLGSESGVGPKAPASPAAVPSIIAPPTATQPPSGPLTLEESIQIAFQNHGDVGVAREQFESAAERVISSRAPRAPQLSVESGYNNRSVVNRSNGTVGVSGSSNSTSTDLVLRQNIFDSGLNNAQTRQARANERGALFGLGQARSGIAFQVAQTYFEQLRTAKLLDLAKEQVRLAEDNLKLVQAQAEAGVAAKVDQTPVEVELRQRQFDLTQAQNNARTAQVNFRNAIGLGRGPALPIQDVSGEAPPVDAVDTFFAEAQRMNPDLKIQRANVEAAVAGLDIAAIRARPQVSVDGVLAAGIFDSPRRQSALTASLNLPILGGGARRADCRAAQDQLQATQLREEQLAKDIAADIEASYSTVTNARESIASARALEESAATNLSVAQEKYRQGLGIALEITTAQVQLFNAQISTIQALYNYYQAQAALERSTGRRSGLSDAPVTPTTAAVVATPNP